MRRPLLEAIVTLNFKLRNQLPLALKENFQSMINSSISAVFTAAFAARMIVSRVELHLRLPINLFS